MYITDLRPRETSLACPAHTWPPHTSLAITQREGEREGRRWDSW